MKTQRTSTRIITIFILLFIVSLNLSTTHAYWASSILGSNTNASNNLNIGAWEFGNPEEPGPTNPYEDYTPPGDPINEDEDNEGEFIQPENTEIYIPGNPTNNQEIETGDVVFYEGYLYIATEENPQGSPNQMWAPYISVNGFIYQTNTNYFQNQIVLHNGYLYKLNENTSNDGTHLLDSNKYSVYDAFIMEYNPNKVYGAKNSNLIVHYSGKYYRHEGYVSKNQPPSPSNSWQWQEVVIPSYNPATSYNTNNMVLFNGNVYKAVRNLTDVEPGSEYNAWNRIDTYEWQWYNVYDDNSYVMYNNVYFKAVSGSSYNNNVKPGTVAGTWNRVDTIYYKSTNQYYTGDIVVHQLTIDDEIIYRVYKATQNSVGVLPNSINGHLYWE